MVDCSSGTKESNTSCNGVIDPLSTIELEFNFEWLEDWNTASFDLIWKTNHGFFTNKVVPDLKILSSWHVVIQWRL